MLLFLPSLLTLITVFIQRVRMARASKAERAPKDAVARLPVFRWGEAEKPDSPAGAGAGAAAMRDLGQDEEREVGIAHVPVSSAAGADEPTEETALLHADAADEHASRAAPSLIQRLTSRLPAPLTRVLPPSLRPAPVPTPHRAAPRATRRYPSLTECPFCLSDFETGDLVMELPCSHVFHAEEIETWLQGQKGVCPICRMSVLAPPADEATLSGAVAAAVAQEQPHGHEDEEGRAPSSSSAVGAGAAVVLVRPLRAPTGTTDPTPPPPPQPSAASPVASSSSVPLEGASLSRGAPAGSGADRAAE